MKIFKVHENCKIIPTKHKIANSWKAMIDQDEKWMNKLLNEKGEGKLRKEKLTVNLPFQTICTRGAILLSHL